MTKIYEPEFEDSTEREGFRYRRARIGRQAGAVRLGASLYELAPGQAAWPYHAHLANEELLIVLRGRPSLRTPDGWRDLAEGEVVPSRAASAGEGLELSFRTEDRVDYWEGEGPPSGVSSA